MTTLYAVIGLFALAAIIGMYLLTLVLQKKETPKGVAVIHGVFAAVALVILIGYTTNNSPGPVESIVLFIIAALGGFYLFYRDITNKPIPRWLAVGHGLIAVTGFLILLVFTFSK